MKIYLAGVPGGGRPGDCKREQEINNKFNLSRLHSYFHLSETKGQLMKEQIDLFLDSGAFSAFTQGIQIDIEEYIQFIKEHKDYLQVYANLDVIGDPVGTWRNQKIMEESGLNPLPCFHYGEDKKWLRRYLDKGHDYIAFGGMVPISTNNLRIWLDDLFANYISDKNGFPIIKVHGFGLTSLSLMLRYPWYSVDSTSWVMTGRMGSIYVPKYKNGTWVYDENSWKICVSTKSPSKNEAGKHIDTFTPKIKEIILEYIHDKKYVLGKSEFRFESEKYELKENEKWASKAANSKREVETIIESGLCNDYKLRDEINIIYFLDLEKNMPEWPWSFKLKGAKGFSL
ncbi:MAG: BcepGomrgp31 [candidate division WS6 bacterium GW2011_GWF1_35_23]|uniref:BcepGomrgp31 n=1 Tax=candidate division WS6 bacterium GW2011_GWF1_35_23 TaxID=1619097 RepID=A0A0G0FDX2_9BACT|nr:MAG: BcepGomrgp31 [candidate division WS6 bacterium GW2011_GWF1_35_23]